MNDYGTAHLYGVAGTISNATVQDFSLDDVFANKGTTENESGNVIERRSDDETWTGKLTLKIQSAYTIPAPGTLLTWLTIVYEITKVAQVQKNKGFRMVTLDFITSANVALS